MKAKEFNELTSRLIGENLDTSDFKKSGVHFYIYEPPNIMVFYKKVFRGSFEGFTLALTHDFISNTKNDTGKFKIPTYLEDYPVSISIDTLARQYKEHRTSVHFDCDMNFLTREVLTTRKHSNSNPIDFLSFESILNEDKKAEEYINSSIKTLSTDGMKFFKEFSPALSYMVLTKYQNLDAWQINQFKDEILKYMEDNNLEIPQRKKSWWKKIMNK